jgi:rhodanese-related sulfurtransferase
MTKNLIHTGVLRFSCRSYQQVRDELLARRGIARLDVHEEDPHAEAHPLFSANLPDGRIEFDASTKLPQRHVLIVLLDGVDGLAVSVATRLCQLGYTDVSLVVGGELFPDVTVPSKAVGELVEAERQTPSLAALEVQALIDGAADIVILDARRDEAYQAMSIPGGIDVPGTELALRARALAQDPATCIIVNWAGRTGSIIGSQSLNSAGLSDPVAALRSGTIGRTLAGQQLVHGQMRVLPGRATGARCKHGYQVI